MSMQRAVIFVLLLILLVTMLVLAGSCGVVGSDIRFEGLSLGDIAMEGKPLNGLPSDRINVDLDVAAQTIKVRTSAGSTVLTLLPSGATVEITDGSISFKGLRPNQVKVEWAVKPSE